VKVRCTLDGAEDGAAADRERLGELLGEVRTRQRHATKIATVGPESSHHELMGRKPRTIGTVAQHRQKRAFKPVAIELGWVVREWNRLHEALAELFADVVASADRAIPFAIWYSAPSDRTQREMLKEVVVAAYRSQQPQPPIVKEINWILNQVKSLAGKRNSAIHAPLVFVNQTTDIEIMPAFFFGNPRARELMGKTLLGEFKWYRDHLEKLAWYAEILHFVAKDSPWPDPRE
jgi:hypothetical protein